MRSNLRVYEALPELRNPMDRVLAELVKATEKHGPMLSQHEGYAVILEELDEAWEEIKRNNKEAATEEMIQVAAMALRFLIDVGRFKEVK